MSFILDALKKSETDRQQQTGAEFSNVPSSPGEPQSFHWLWILAALLIVNIAVLAGILLRSGKTPDVTAPAETAAPEQTKIVEPSFEEQVAAAKQNQPPPVETAAAGSQSPRAAVRPAIRPRVLTIDEVRVNGTLQITDLHLDIHVYDDDPAKRFVFINMTKHREQSELDEGPAVLEITPEGVILEHQGTIFLLPRE